MEKKTPKHCFLKLSILNLFHENYTNTNLKKKKKKKKKNRKLIVWNVFTGLIMRTRISWCSTDVCCLTTTVCCVCAVNILVSSLANLRSIRTFTGPSRTSPCTLPNITQWVSGHALQFPNVVIYWWWWKWKKKWKLQYINPKGKFTMLSQEQRQGTSV